MKILKQIQSLSFILYLSIFVVTQVTGLLLSLSVCFILQDFIWGFVRIALVNSFIMGISLIGCCFLSQNLLFKIKTFYVIFISFSVIMGTGIISFVVLLYYEPTLFIYYYRGAITFLFINFLFIIALYLISSGLIVYREIMAQKERALGDERFLKNQMEMKLLSSKVNPHFLFNTLNMILNLLKKPEIAEVALLNLSDLLRNNLEYSEKKVISIKDEIDNVRKYLEIQKLRFEEKLHYTIIGDEKFDIPPLTIQPLIENSIKHNISRVKRLEIIVNIFKHNGRNVIKIIDSEKAVNESMLHKGQGLTITKKRIENSGGSFTITNGGIEISFNHD
jgi:sensor histidine kinase YesM